MKILHNFALNSERRNKHGGRNWPVVDGCQLSPLHRSASLQFLEATAMPDQDAPCGANPAEMKCCQIRVWILMGHWCCQICVRNLWHSRAANSPSKLDSDCAASSVSVCRQYLFDTYATSALVCCWVARCWMQVTVVSVHRRHYWINLIWSLTYFMIFTKNIFSIATIQLFIN